MSQKRIGTDLPVAVTLIVATSVGYASWFSRSLYDAGAYDGYYRQGIYRYRVVGRELVWFLHGTAGNPLGEHLAPRIPGADPGAMFTALVLVNGAALALTCVLVHQLLVRRGPAEPGRTLVYVSLVTLIAASSYVVTPYDQLGYLLLLAVLVAAEARPPFDLAAPALALVAVANRETAFVAVAALVAVRWPDLRAGGRPDRRSAVTIAVAAVTLAGYVALRLIVDDTGGEAILASLPLRGNGGRLLGWGGGALLVAMAGWWWSICSVARFGMDAETGAALRRLWLLAAPYLLVAGLTGYWFEVRLLVPLLLAECWVRARAGEHADDPAARMAHAR